MPLKRRGKFGRQTPAAKRMAEARATETPEERQLRQRSDRDRASETRAAETPEERQLESTRRGAARSSAWVAQINDAFSYDPDIEYEKNVHLEIGSMSNVYSHCGAKKWKKEAPGICCVNGKVSLSPLSQPVEPLLSLMSGETSQSRDFLKNIRAYNSCFAMTSFAAHKVNEGWTPTFKIQGQVYHKIGSLRPVTGSPPAFLQIYFMRDEEAQVERRNGMFHGRTDPDVIRSLQEMLNAHNKYVQDFKSTMERMPSSEDNFRIVIHANRTPSGQHVGRYNPPATNEVAVLMVGELGVPRDIVLQARSHQLQNINDTHPSYDALQYPLILWKGEDGYNYDKDMQLDPDTGRSTDRKVSANDFYAYRLMYRENEFNHLLRCQRLAQQFIVDMYAKIENERLRFIRLNQKTLRAEEYGIFRDAMVNDNVPTENLGKFVILPFSFTGGPRYMHEYVMDAMTYVRNRGTPDLFITCTCNPAWPEIIHELLPGQKSPDRVDLTARVFRQKVIKLMDIIKKMEVFGKVSCWMYSIEWQKRGLPHIHLLVWLDTKIRPNQVDSFICAEIPNKTKDPILYDVVTKNMIHGPCGRLNPNSPCMKDGKCTKKFPKPLIHETQTGNNGYPLYRPRKPGEGGFEHTMKIGNSTITVNNSWVVPYCPLLSRIFKSHINVEYCNSVKSIKYICKYITKGSDAAVFKLQGDQQENRLDEVTTYQQGRYISSSEAAWRIFTFPIHERYPTVVHLAVHPENGQRIFFKPGQPIHETDNPPKTTLTEFFEICKTDPLARTLLYPEMPVYFVWSRNKWTRRKQGTVVAGFPEYRATNAMGRVYTVHPNNREAFHLRLLLHTVRGPTSFESLRLVEKRDDENELLQTIQCATFTEACKELGLLEDDTQWNEAMKEAALFKSPRQLRDLFSVLISNCELSDPYSLWIEYRDSLTEDILHIARLSNPLLEVQFSEDMYNKTLILLEDKIESLIGKTLEVFGLPSPKRDQVEMLPMEMLRETSYDSDKMQDYVAANEPKLTPDQRIVYEALLQIVSRGKGGVVFLDAPGETGKTFLMNLLLANIRKDKDIAIAVASSGIAATLLTGGRTAHSTLKIPLNLAQSETPVCNISKTSGLASVLQQCKLIIWDEATMSNKKAVEALDRTLRDLRGNDNIMGTCPCCCPATSVRRCQSSPEGLLRTS